MHYERNFFDTFVPILAPRQNSQLMRPVRQVGGIKQNLSTQFLIRDRMLSVVQINAYASIFHDCTFAFSGRHAGYRISGDGDRFRRGATASKT